MKKHLFALFCAACALAANASEGALPWAFTVNAEGGRIAFSRGNLQFNQSGRHATAQDSAAGTWRFAEHQYDTIGSNNTLNTANGGWLSFFGWGTSGYNNTKSDPYAVCYQPWEKSGASVSAAYNSYGYGPSTHMTDADLVGTSAYYDWGVYNAISNGGDRPGLWRLLSWPEWEYLLRGRENALALYGLAKVNGTNGIIILPDGWTPIAKLPFVPIISDATTYQTNPDGSISSVHPNAWHEDCFAMNIYTLTQWAVMEEKGAVFLPAEGWYKANRKGQDCNYWTSTHYDATYSFRFLANNGVVDPSYSGSGNRYLGFSVRLVQDYVALDSIALDRDSLIISVGDTDTLRAAVMPDDAAYTEIVWTSSDPSVATVGNGVVTAVGSGETAITATASGGAGGTLTAVCTVSVYDPAATNLPKTAVRARKCVGADGVLYILLPDGTRITAQGIRMNLQ